MTDDGWSFYDRCPTSSMKQATETIHNAAVYGLALTPVHTSATLDAKALQSPALMQILSITVFALACAAMFYALFGYPLLLGWMAGRANNPVHKDDKLRSVSFVIAVYNGEKFLERKLNSIFSLNYPRHLMDILVVSDGSTDRTDEIARSFASQGVRFLRVPHGGKAAALNAAVPLVAGEIRVLNDVRQTLDPDCLRNIIASFGDPKVGSVSPRTVIVEGDIHEEAATSAYWRYEDWIRQRLTRIDSTFGYSGAFAAMRRSLWTPLPPGTLLDDVYVPLKAFFQGYRILYEPTATRSEERRVGKEF